MTIKDIKYWLYYMQIDVYTINDDLTIDVDGNVNIDRRNLDNIPIQFGRVNGGFFCSENNLTSLKGCPYYVEGHFSCADNEITSMEYSPKYVGFDAYYQNNKITTLEYSPEYIGRNFHISNNPLINLTTDTKNLIGDMVLYNCKGIENSIHTFNIHNDIKILLKHQDDYGIWNSDGSYNEKRFKIFMLDYNNGLLK